jgi:hypothetical protein
MLVIPAKAGTHLFSWFKVVDWGELGPRFRGDGEKGQSMGALGKIRVYQAHAGRIDQPCADRGRKITSKATPACNNRHSINRPIIKPSRSNSMFGFLTQEEMVPHP